MSARKKNPRHNTANAAIVDVLVLDRDGRLQSCGATGTGTSAIAATSLERARELGVVVDEARTSHGCARNMTIALRDHRDGLHAGFVQIVWRDAPMVRASDPIEIVAPLDDDEAPDDVTARVHGVIASALHDHVRPTLRTTAEALGASPRSLQRWLSAHGTTHRALLADVRRDLAERLLRSHRGVSITDVALQLGFSDLGSFERSFKQWTGETPSHVRSKHARSQTPTDERARRRRRRAPSRS